MSWLALIGTALALLSLALNFRGLCIRRKAERARREHFASLLARPFYYENRDPIQTGQQEGPRHG